MIYLLLTVFALFLTTCTVGVIAMREADRNFIADQEWGNLLAAPSTSVTYLTNPDSI